MRHTLFAALLQSPYLIEGAGRQMLYAQVAQLLTTQQQGGEEPTFVLPPIAAYAPHAAALGLMNYTSLDEVPAGSIAVHVVSGVMFPDDYYWNGPGTQTLGRRIKQADAHENIVAHVGVFQTPGGSTMGLEDFAGIIAGTQKPFVSYLKQACSAGYWSASGGNALMVAGRTAVCGSIGTMAEFLDFTGYFEQMGIKQITAYATKSTNKNGSFHAAIAGDLKPLQKELLDPLNEVFLSTVQTNRAGKLDPKQEEEVLSGMCYVGQTNIDNGLADSMGSLDDAVALAQQLADEAAAAADTNATTNHSNTHTMFGKNKFTAMLALAGLTAAATTPELVTAANDELETAGITGASLITEAAYNDLTAKAGRVDAAEASAKGFTDALATAGAKDMAELVAQRDAYKAKADQFDKQGGAEHTTPNLAAGKTDVDKGEVDANQQAIDALPHNSALDNHPLFGKRVAG